MHDFIRSPAFSLARPNKGHTGREHANLQAIPLMLLASSVNTPPWQTEGSICVCPSPRVSVWTGPTDSYQVLEQEAPLDDSPDADDLDLQHGQLKFAKTMFNLELT